MIKLKDAMEQELIKPGDFFDRRANQSMVMADNGVLRWGNKDGKAVAICNHHLNMEGEIIKKKQEPVSASIFSALLLEIETKYKDDIFSMCVYDSKRSNQLKLTDLVRYLKITSFRAGAKNERLFYAELVKIANDYINDRNLGQLTSPGDYAQRFDKELKKIEAHENN